MFSSAFKSFGIPNIFSNYEISKQSTATSGAWQVFDAKKKSTGGQASVFVFDRKSLDVSTSGFGARQSATSVRKAQDEVVDRLKKEAGSLARLRHPSILQLVEPVEETRNGGLMFATEPIVASLAGALGEKDNFGRSRGGVKEPRRTARQDAAAAEEDGELELDELEIQKGLLQVAKGLEFLHDSAKLVHGNLTPDAVFINAKSDWKISGMAFTGPPDGAEGHQPIPQISLSEVLYHDSRLPRFVQLDLDYTSPDFVLDTNINFSADIFSLGLVILAIYNVPHRSPVETHGNQSTYKKIFSSPQTTPLPQNKFLCTQDLPRELIQTLPRLLGRRPAQRMTASEFQQSEYFDNILVNTIRFLDALPAKTPYEKAQFMRGLGRVMPQFPVSVLGRKVLSALLDELKDRELLALILQNLFKIIERLPSSKRTFPERVLPRLREVFLSKSKSEERDSGKEAGLVVVFENVELISKNCSAKEFKDDILPILQVGMESPTSSLVDASLQCIRTILPILDFSTVKHELFPVVASVFSKTSSLNIKVRGLEAIGILCGASSETSSNEPDDFSGLVEQDKKPRTVSSLDKFTMQEKVVPLLKGIKTKEPAVMMAALTVFRQVGKLADAEFVAIEVMPVLWSFSLGPLLNLTQFKAYMDLVKSMSSKIEREHIRKLQELSSVGKASGTGASIPTAGATNGLHSSTGTIGAEDDFERLVLSSRSGKPDPFAGALSTAEKLTPNPPSFSWLSPKDTAATNLGSMASLQPQPASRSVTPDVSISSFPSLQPRSASSSALSLQPQAPTQYPVPTSAQPIGSRAQNQSLQAFNLVSNYVIAPPPSLNNAWQASSNPIVSPVIMPPPPAPQQGIWQRPTYSANANPSSAFGVSTPALAPQQNQSQSQTQQKTGLDKYESLL